MARLTDEELLDTLEKQLPALLERHPELEPRIYAAFIRTFATKQEVAAVLSELRAFRGEFDAFRTEVQERFDQVDARFDQVDARFERVDGQFKGVDARFDQVDARFDQVDARFERVDARFERVDARFKGVDARFDQVDARFERVDQEFSDLRDWVELVVGRLQTRSGRNLENVVAGALRLALERDDIVPEKIRLQERIEDAEGRIGPAGRRYEVDVLAEDGRLMVFEVKSVCEAEDVVRLGDKVALMQALNPDKSVEGVMVALEPEEAVRAQCEALGIALVS